MADELHVTEEKSQRELANTVVSPATARFLSIAFIGLITLPAALQIAAQLRSGTVLREFRSLAGPPSREKFRAFEQALDNNSILRRYWQPRAQAFLSGVGGFGNEKVSLSRSGWLYYASGLRYVYGMPFLDTDFLNARTKNMVNKEAEADPNPDPRPALFDLAEDCRKRGIRLVLAPIPDKGMVEARQLTGRISRQAPPPNNASFPELVAGLKSKGADVFEDFPSHDQSNGSRYLKQDTHWNPRFMEEAAARLARYVLSLGVLPAPVRAPRFRLAASTYSHVGDLVNMLRLPTSQTQFPAETVEIHRVIDDATGRPVTPSPDASLLLLGDSFTNVFSLASLGWGEGAGFGEHLAYQLNQTIDVIALNGGGAYDVRIALLRGAMEGRLEGKKVLVYEFAMRNLALENWKRVRLPESAHTGSLAAVKAPVPANPAPAPDQPTAQKHPASQDVPGAAKLPPTESASVGESDGLIRLVGKVRKLSAMPVPGVSPYRDCLNLAQIEVERVLSGKYDDSVMLAAFEVMRDNQLTENAQLRPGDRLELEVQLLRNSAERFQTMQRSDDLADFEHRPYLALSCRTMR